MEPQKVNYSKQELEKIFGKEATAPATEQEIEKAYYFLGIIATKFAEIEKHLQALLGLMAGLKFVGYKLIESNSLEKNLQLLKELNKWEKFKETDVAYFIKGISDIKPDRNSLIHGVWEIFRDENHEPVISVRSYKSKYSIEDGKDTWKMGTQRLYSFKDMLVLIERAKELNERLKDILAAFMAKDHPGSEPMLRQMLK